MNELILDTCKTGKDFSANCLYRMLCPQIPNYIVKTSIILMISIILVSWAKWWYLKYGYIKYPVPNNKIFGNIQERETRIYWDLWIMNRMIKACIIFILIIAWIGTGMK